MPRAEILSLGEEVKSHKPWGREIKVESGWHMESIVICVCLYMCRTNSGRTQVAPGTVVASRERSRRWRWVYGVTGYGDTRFSLHAYLWMDKSTLMCNLEVQFNYNYVRLHYWYSPLLDVTMILGEWQSGIRQVHRHCLLGYVHVSPAMEILITTVSRVEGSFSPPFARWYK